MSPRRAVGGLSLLVVIAWVGMAAPLPASAEELDLDRVIAMAVAGSEGLEIFQHRVAEAEARTGEARSLRRPRLFLGGFGGYNTNPIDIRLKTGSLDAVTAGLLGEPAVAPFLDAVLPLPGLDIPLVHGDEWFGVGTLAVIQPLSQQAQIGTGIDVAAMDLAVARAELARTEAEVRYGAEELFYGLLIAERRLAAEAAAVRLAEAELRHATDAVEEREMRAVAVSGLAAELMKARADELKAGNEIGRLKLQLNDLTRRPLDADVALDSQLPPRPPIAAPEEVVRMAAERNPGVVAALCTTRKAALGVKAASQDRRPDVDAVGSYIVQDGLPVIQSSFGLLGVAVTWDVYDFGKSKAIKERRQAQQRQAVANAERLRTEVEMKIRMELKNLEDATALHELAGLVVEFRLERLSLARDLVAEQVALDIEELEAAEELAEAETDLLASELGVRLARTRLEHLSGLSSAVSTTACQDADG